MKKIVVGLEEWLKTKDFFLERNLKIRDNQNFLGKTINMEDDGF